MSLSSLSNSLSLSSSLQLSLFSAPLLPFCAACLLNSLNYLDCHSLPAICLRSVSAISPSTTSLPVLPLSPLPLSPSLPQDRLRPYAAIVIDPATPCNTIGLTVSSGRITRYLLISLCVDVPFLLSHCSPSLRPPLLSYSVTRRVIIASCLKR